MLSTIYETIKKEQQLLSERIDFLHQKLQSYPPGELLCVKYKKYTKWFLSNHANPIYLPKSNFALAKTLAAKKYDTLMLNQLLKEQTLLNNLLTSLSLLKNTCSDLLCVDSAYKDLLNAHFNDFPEHISHWITEDYPKKQDFSESLIFKTLSGHLVRSKSEVIIANTLFLNKIPYRYECELDCKIVKLYPDFTIYHPKNNKLIYWEHFGMMDHPSYRDQTYNKLKILGTCDIIPGINLITTYETLKVPIDSSQILKIVKENFL